MLHYFSRLSVVPTSLIIGPENLVPKTDRVTRELQSLRPDVRSSEMVSMDTPFGIGWKLAGIVPERESVVLQFQDSQCFIEQPMLKFCRQLLCGPIEEQRLGVLFEYGSGLYCQAALVDAETFTTAMEQRTRVRTKHQPPAVGSIVQLDAEGDRYLMCGMHSRHVNSEAQFLMLNLTQGTSRYVQDYMAFYQEHDEVIPELEAMAHLVMESRQNLQEGREGTFVNVADEPQRVLSPTLLQNYFQHSNKLVIQSKSCEPDPAKTHQTSYGTYTRAWTLFKRKDGKFTVHADTVSMPALKNGPIRSFSLQKQYSHLSTLTQDLQQLFSYFRFKSNSAKELPHALHVA